MKQSKNQDKITFRQAFSLHYRGFNIIRTACPKLFLSIFLHNVCDGVSPYVAIYLSARIIDELAGGRDPQKLLFLVIIALACAAAFTLLGSVLWHWRTTREQVWQFMKEKLYNDKWADMDFCDHDRQYTHDLHSQIQQNNNFNGWGLAKLPWYFSDAVRSITGIISAISLTVTLFVLQVPEEGGSLTVLNNPLFIVVLIAVMLAVTFISPLFYAKAYSFWAENAETAKEGNRLYAYFCFLSARPERALDFRMFDQQKLCDHYCKRMDFFTKGGKLHKLLKGRIGLFLAISEVISNIFTGIVYVFVCLKAWAGAFSVGAVTQYISSISTLSKNVSQLVFVLGDLKNNAVFLKTAYEFLDIPNNMYQGSLTTEKRRDRDYEVEFCDVSFKYPDTDIYALRHLSLKFKIGERLAVVGMNGSGKTTFIKLLCRLYDPTEGVIKLNGIDIRKYRYDDYMSIFSIVFQDFKLFALPLGENVAISAKYDEAKVIDCLNKAGFSDRLAEMPDKLQTYLYRDIEKDGVMISGGEAQKLAIARSLYKDAPFIILDEPTAALDPIAEAEIYSKFNEIAGDKTAIYISHRLSSCRFCDNIAVFHEGSIIQQGTHDDLLADENGKYYELWYAQAQYYEQENQAV